MGKRFSCHKISGGKAEGAALFSGDDFCFYLVDPNTGIVIEKNHCLEGQSIAGKVLIFPNGKGSSVVQADGMYQLKMKGTEPRAMIIRNPDTTLVASAIIMETPLVDRVDEEFYRTVKDGDILEVDADAGLITLKS
jgi:predicted aconitase with swiveling domain